MVVSDASRMLAEDVLGELVEPMAAWLDGRKTKVQSGEVTVLKVGNTFDEECPWGSLTFEVTSGTVI